MFTNRLYKVKINAPANSQIKTNGTSIPPPMGTVKKITLMMALVTGSITALMRSSMLSWAWASSGRHDRNSKVNRWIIVRVLSQT